VKRTQLRKYNITIVVKDKIVYAIKLSMHVIW
jgi:hypothetical protein